MGVFALWVSTLLGSMPCGASSLSSVKPRPDTQVSKRHSKLHKSLFLWEEQNRPLSIHKKGLNL